jgi:hypothetical protein
MRAAHLVCMVEQTPDVGGICPNGVLGKPALQAKVPDEGGENVRSIWCLAHLCTVAGYGHIVKYREPDAPKIAE